MMSQPMAKQLADAFLKWQAAPPGSADDQSAAEALGAAVEKLMDEDKALQEAYIHSNAAI